MAKPTSKKQKLIEELAHFLVDRQAGKSILLQMGAERPGGDKVPVLAQEWAKLRNAAGIHGYPDFDEAVKMLTEVLD